MRILRPFVVGTPHPNPLCPHPLESRYDTPGLLSTNAMSEISPIEYFIQYKVLFYIQAHLDLFISKLPLSYDHKATGHVEEHYIRLNQIYRKSN